MWAVFRNEAIIFTQQQIKYLPYIFYELRVAEILILLLRVILYNVCDTVMKSVNEFPYLLQCKYDSGIYVHPIFDSSLVHLKEYYCCGIENLRLFADGVYWIWTHEYEKKQIS
jgi:hypothetical protein